MRCWYVSIQHDFDIYECLMTNSSCLCFEALLSPHLLAIYSYVHIFSYDRSVEKLCMVCIGFYVGLVVVVNFIAVYVVCKIPNSQIKSVASIILTCYLSLD